MLTCFGFSILDYQLDALISLQVILPFSLAAYFIASYQHKLDPLMALFGFSEYTFMNWSRIQDPYVRGLLNEGALVTLLFAIVIAATLSLLFIFVPGKRI
jgi:hypothetical protein